MNEDRIKGSMTEAKGKIKEAAGKMTGDEKLKREGQADQVAGKVRTWWVAWKTPSRTQTSTATSLAGAWRHPRQIAAPSREYSRRARGI